MKLKQWYKWNEWGLYWRLFVPVMLLISMAGTLRSITLANEEANEALQRTQTELHVLALALSPLLVDYAITGDYSGIAQMLREQVAGNPELSTLEWRYDNTLITSTDPVAPHRQRPEASAPDWFVRFLDLQSISYRTKLEFSRQYYGELTLRSDPLPAQGRAWHRFRTQVFAALGLITLLALLLSLLLRQSLASLRTLTDSVRRFQTDASQRAPEEGANEIRALGMAFNQMAQCKQEAEKANEAKSNFLSHVSHEIRTPMNAIIGLSHLALKTDLTAKQSDYVQKIHQSGRHLLCIINNILDLSKIEAGKFEIDDLEFDLDRDVLNRVETLISDRAAGKGIALRFEIDATLPGRLRGDPLHLSQILINLTNNAVNHTQQGAIVLRVRQLAETAHDVSMRFEVRDSGSGIAPEQISRLFQSFQQIATTSKRQYAGTGLGLAISKSLVELMGGEIGVDSTLGSGSTFWFTLRLGKSVALNAQAADLHDRRMLVVDDHLHATEIMASLLRDMGCRTDLAGTGKQAIEAVMAADESDDPYDAVFLDWHMPGMDGIETSHRLQALKLTHTRPPHIMVTAHDADLATSEAKASPIEAVLIKPVAPAILRDTILRALPPRQPASGAGRKPVPAADTQAALFRATRILVADDNPFNLQVSTELLQDAGVAVLQAGNGKEVLELLEREQVDCVLMDMQMPQMDGLAATRQLRANPAHAGLRIIAMTANAMAEDRERCLSAGMDDFLTKPIDPDELYATLNRWLKLEPAAQGGRRPDHAQPSSSGLCRDPRIIDLSVLEKTVGNHSGRIYKLARKYVESTRAALAEIECALVDEDMAALSRIGHRVKASSLAAGAIGVFELCLALEQFKHGGSVTQAQHIVGQLPPLLEKIEQQLAGYVSSGTS
ncbi:MAG TPA: response regulator [Gallionellaceae bacterium]